jgi:hypothetical protein
MCLYLFVTKAKFKTPQHSILSYAACSLKPKQNILILGTSAVLWQTSDLVSQHEFINKMESDLFKMSWKVNQVQ